ncbi:TRAP transporter substrate-binding protein [Fertoebacter nigrum]|uniref:TRAP transporter substrate-binding protein n=1 Tax=Fertoeibacter niger TaxID=2656921 RepID=A0A8X8H3T9_9RHOB|nr:TRAP transporter substrate-binding protein [Fertoeibacter niger]NUB45839.1 TRAP transporter substrate-binding protein [Fertoeibacter niger]
MNTPRRQALKLACSVAFATLLSSAAFAQEVTLKFHQFLPQQAPIPSLVLDVWAKKVEAESGGRIKIEQYPAMQLGGKPTDLMDQVVDGIADIVWTLPGYTPGRFPQSEVFELPFVAGDAEATSRAYWELAEKYMIDGEFKDIKVLGLWTHGPGLIHSKTPITSVADLAGVKLRAPTRVTNMMATSLGATAVGMPVPAVPEALSKGVIDATIIPWEVTGSIRLSELLGNHTEFPGAPLYTAAFVMAMNKDVYAGLPDDLKAIIDANSGLEFSAMAGRVSQEADGPARQLAVDAGNTIVELTPEQIEEWKVAAQPTIDTWLTEITEKGIDGAALLEEARAAIAKHSATN